MSWVLKEAHHVVSGRAQGECGRCGICENKGAMSIPG